MKIDRLQWYHYDTKGKNRDGSRRTSVALRLITDQDAEGWVNLRHWAWMWKEWEWRHQAPDAGEFLAGKDAGDIDAIWHKMYGHFHIGIVTLVDIALWDLKGKLAGKPVHGLFGTKRDKVKMYRSTPFNLGTPADYAAYALECRERGYHGFKIHPTRNDQEDTPARGDVETDIKIYRAVQQAVGGEMALMSDPYHTYSFEEAVRVGKVLDELGYTWYESPMNEEDEWLVKYVELNKKIETPLCAPETGGGSYQRRIAWIRKGATEMGRIDLAYGGFTPLLKIADECIRRGITMDLHLNDPYHLQLHGMTTEQTLPFFEDYGRPPGIDMDDEGYRTIPDTPGMGGDLDWEYIERNKV